MSKDLINYQETIFSKIKKFFKNITTKKESESVINNINHKRNFSENIVVRESREEARLRRLKISFDNREINEEKISDKDIDKLIQMYDREIEELKNDTERRKKNIEGIIRSKK